MWAVPVCVLDCYSANKQTNKQSQLEPGGGRGVIFLILKPSAVEFTYIQFHSNERTHRAPRRALLFESRRSDHRRLRTLSLRPQHHGQEGRVGQYVYNITKCRALVDRLKQHRLSPRKAQSAGGGQGCAGWCRPQPTGTFKNSRDMP